MIRINGDQECYNSMNCMSLCLKQKLKNLEYRSYVLLHLVLGVFLEIFASNSLRFTDIE